MFTGWRELILKRFHSNKEFVSVDAHQYPARTRSYEMIVANDKDADAKSPAAVIAPLTSATYAGRGTRDYSSREASYTSPSQSFSSPKVPQGPGWDPTTTYAGPQTYGNMNPLAMHKA